jgi:hypothetical protein
MRKTLISLIAIALLTAAPAFVSAGIISGTERAASWSEMRACLHAQQSADRAATCDDVMARDRILGFCDCYRTSDRARPYSCSVDWEARCRRSQLWY